MMQKSFIFDLNKCTGCQACQFACEIENQTVPGESWRTINTFNPQHHPGVPVFHYSMACNHCLDAPCMKYCPALAISKDSETGAVNIDPSKCIGCKYCSWVCPYDAPKFNTSSHIMEKCTFCSHRLKENRDPACVSGCPTGALGFGNYEQKSLSNDEFLPGFPETGIRPAIKLVKLRKENEYPQLTSSNSSILSSAHQKKYITGNARKISLKNEWPLAVFTLAASVLVALLCAAMLSGITVNPVYFLISGLVGMNISTMHLGEKIRALRAVLNWKRSWISREIILFSTFLILGFLYLLPVAYLSNSGWIITVIGYGALFSMDKVYDIRGRLGWKKLHSGGVLLTSLYLAGVFSGTWIMIGWFGFWKMFFYTIRKNYWKKTDENPRIVLSVLRIFLGFIFPITLYQLTGTNYVLIIFLSVLLGDLIDRCEFYLEFELLTPEVQIRNDLEIMLKKESKNRGRMEPVIR